VQTINLDLNETKSKQVVTEVKTLHDASSPYIVSYHGAFFKDRAISVVLVSATVRMDCLV